MEETKYAVIVVVIEDTEEALEALTESVDAWDGALRGLTYEEAETSLFTITKGARDV